MANQSAIGRDLRRPDGLAKTRGDARYVADLEVADALVGGAVRSPVARGTLVGWDRDPNFDFSQVVVALPADIPGDNVQALIEDDQPILCEREIQHVGEVLALIAAPDPGALQAAIAAMRPRIEEHEAELDFEHSTKAFKELTILKGDVDSAFAAGEDAALCIEHTWRTDSQEQLYIETQGIIAWPPDAEGVVRIVGSLQCPHYVQKALMRMLDRPAEQCRVAQAATGGGFGGKEEYPSVLACHAALLALLGKRPVKMIYDRHEDLAVTPKRHPSRVIHRTAVAPDGRLLAMDIDVLFDGGAYATLSSVVLSRGIIHAAGPYRCDNVRVRGRVVRTNHVPYGAFRGFGAPQTCFALERQMDQVAAQLDMHPFELRYLNRLRIGDTTATGQVLDDSCAATEVLDRAAEITAIDRHDQPVKTSSSEPTGRTRRGRGMSFFFHGAGFTGSGEEFLKGSVRVGIDADGRARLFTGSTEIGQGTITLFTALASEALGCRIDDLVLEAPDTANVPDSGPTVASRTCMIVGRCIVTACEQLATRLGNPAPEEFRAAAASWLTAGGDGAVTVTYRSPEGLRWDDATYQGDAYPTYGWAVDVAEVEVDMDSFEVTVLDFATIVDVGKAIQPMLVRGQLEGGSLQAIGFAHREVVTTSQGRFREDRLSTCIIPTALDAPPMRVELVEKPFAHGPFGAKGVGELPMDGGAPAIAAAIDDALGIVTDRVPATPERLLEAWERS